MTRTSVPTKTFALPVKLATTLLALRFAAMPTKISTLTRLNASTGTHAKAWTAGITRAVFQVNVSAPPVSLEAKPSLCL